MRTEMLVLGYRTAQMIISANLAGVSQEESLEQPSKAGNCINWLAGHLLTSRDGLCRTLGNTISTLDDGESQLYKQGSGPLRNGRAAVDVNRLAAELQNSGHALVTRIQAMSEEELDVLIEPKMFPVPVESPSIANLLTLFLFHEAYHAGQMGLGRRLLGKDPGVPI